MNQARKTYPLERVIAALRRLDPTLGKKELHVAEVLIAVAQRHPHGLTQMEILETIRRTDQRRSRQNVTYCLDHLGGSLNPAKKHLPHLNLTYRTVNELDDRTNTVRLTRHGEHVMEHL